MSSQRGGRAAGSATQLDLEAQEQENTELEDLLANRAKDLTKLSEGLRGSVKKQVDELDRVGKSMDGFGGMLKSSVTKFNKAFSNQENKLLFYVVAGCVVVFTLCYLLFKRRV